MKKLLAASHRRCYEPPRQWWGFWEKVPKSGGLVDGDDGGSIDVGLADDIDDGPAAAADVDHGVDDHADVFVIENDDDDVVIIEDDAGVGGAVVEDDDDDEEIEIFNVVDNVMHNDIEFIDLVSDDDDDDNMEPAVPLLTAQNLAGFYDGFSSSSVGKRP